MSKRVLFIDDQIELWKNALCEELGFFDFELRCEEDPSNVLRVISSYNPDVILLDILFPEGYLGKPTLEKIKKKHPSLPVMMITSTMDKSEYKSEDYLQADYRYSKEALTAGDFSDLAAQLDRLIERAKAQEQGDEDDTGLDSFGLIVGKSKAMQEVVEIVEKVADQGHTVLITGESGTGKELVARSIHYAGCRSEGPFIAINCGALTETLLESELFGHEKGAFANAIRRKEGKFKLAHRGSIFLDEVGDMSLPMQIKLLRVLQEREFTRVGGEEVIRVDVRVIAATHKDLQREIDEGKFREDLYFRLNVVPIHIPPLRERKTDIPQFFEHLVTKSNRLSKKNVMPKLRDDVREKLVNHPWPGNVRQLENAINRAVALSDENILQVSNFRNLNQVNPERSGFSSHVSHIADSVYAKGLKWDELKREYGAKSGVRKEVFLKIIGLWTEKNDSRPTSEDLAGLLSTSGNNIRQVLKQCGIKLTTLPKQQ